MNWNARSILTKSAISACLLMAGCKSMPPKVDVKLWAGDSAKAGVSRAQENLTVACTDPAIDELVCMSYADLKKLMDVIWSCQQWPSGMEKMNRTEVEATLKIYSLVARKAQGAKE